MDYYDTLKDECIVYSYALDLAKQFSDNKGNFANVSFKIQNQTDGYYLKAVEDAQIKGQYYVDGEDCKLPTKQQRPHSFRILRPVP